MNYEKEGSSFESYGHYKDELERILKTPVSPENIDTYASHTLDQLVSLIGQAIEGYAHSPTIAQHSRRETEEAAFAYFGLNNIEEILDFVADKNDEINALDTYINSAFYVDAVIVPPDTVTPQEVVERLTPFNPKKHIPRLKTVIFLLQNQFEIDFSAIEPSDFVKGRVDKNMARNESYYALTLPKLERIIYVCDEEGNASYVFDSTILETLNMSPSTLIGLTKTERNQFIIEHPEVGSRLVYSDNFVANMIDLIKSPRSNNELRSTRDTREISFLQPERQQPGNYLTLNKMVPTLPVSLPTLKRIAEELKDQLTDARINVYNALEYSPEDQRIINQYLIDNDYYVGEPPEGYLNIKELEKKFGVTVLIIGRAIELIREELGTIIKAKYGPARTYSYSPEQQLLIKEALVIHNLIVERIKPGYVTLITLAQKLHSSTAVLNLVIEELGDTLGTIETARIDKSWAKVYSPEQQQIIADKLKERRNESTGFGNIKSMSERFGVSEYYITIAVKALGTSLGEVTKKMFRSLNLDAYSEEQQLMVRDYLIEAKLVTPLPPKGYKSRAQISEETGIYYLRLQKSIDELSAELGDVIDARFGSNVSKAYSPDQQSLIIKHAKRLKKASHSIIKAAS